MQFAGMQCCRRSRLPVLLLLASLWMCRCCCRSCHMMLPLHLRPLLLATLLMMLRILFLRRHPLYQSTNPAVTRCLLLLLVLLLQLVVIPVYCCCC